MIRRLLTLAVGLSLVLCIGFLLGAAWAASGGPDRRYVARHAWMIELARNREMISIWVLGWPRDQSWVTTPPVRSRGYALVNGFERHEHWAFTTASASGARMDAPLGDPWGKTPPTALSSFHAIMIYPWRLAIIFGILPIPWMLSYPIRRRLYRRRQNLCLSCGYDVRASIDRCPECGKPIRSSQDPGAIMEWDRYPVQRSS